MADPATNGIAIARSRDVLLDSRYLADTIAAPPAMRAAPASVRIELFPGIVFDFEQTSQSEAFGGGIIWTGEARTPVTAWADLVIRGEQITGHVTVLGNEPKNYRIDPLGAALVHRISELDSGGFPEEAHPGTPPRPDRNAIPAPLDRSEGDPVTIDVFIAHTAAAASAVPDVEASANLAVSLANSAFTRSAVDVQYRLVGTHRVVGYTEPGSYEAILDDLTNGTLPAFQTVHALRESTGADLVALLVNNQQYCGIAWRPNSPSAQTSNLGYSVTTIGCINNHTFAHELGHNVGLHHDRYVSNAAPASQYNYGYVNLPGRFRTVMAYNNECVANGFNCTRINSFSNPNLQHEGRVTGIPAGTNGAADAARWFNETAATIAAYRGSVSPTGPANNLFANRITIPSPTTVSGNNIGATSEPGQPTIGSTSSTNAVWWRFTPPQSGLLTVETCGSDFDTTLAVFTGAAVNALSLVDENDDACGLQSRVADLPVSSGVEYQIAVAGFGNRSGNIQLTVAFTPASLVATTTTLQAPGAGNVGQALTFTARVNAGSGTPQGSVSFRRDGVEFGRGQLDLQGNASLTSSALPQGTATISAHYLGNATFAASASSGQSIVIRAVRLASSVSLVAPGSGEAGQSLTFRARVSAANGQPRGRVSFRRGGVEFASALVNAAGIAVVTSPLPPGTHQVTARYMGTARFAPSISSRQRVVIRAARLATAVRLNVPASAEVGQTIMFRAQVTAPRGTPRGRISFRRGGVEIGSALVNARGIAVIRRSLPPGSHGITARYLGTARFAPSVSPRRSISVQAARQATSVTLRAPANAQIGQVLAFRAQVSAVGWQPRGRVSFRADGVEFASALVNRQGVALVRRVLPQGTHRVTAHYRGNARFAASTSVARVVTVSPLIFGLGRVVTGAEHSCALQPDQQVFCWGSNGQGQLGAGQVPDQPVPVPVSGLSDAVQIDTRGRHTCSVTLGGEVFCWGLNSSGQLGDGATGNQFLPVAVNNLRGIAQIATGLNHSCALRQDGAVLCWGANDNGQLGDGSGVDQTEPVQVAGLLPATAVTAGDHHSCALQVNGTVQCWGDNAAGQLGDGSTEARPVPVAVSGARSVAQIVAGARHSCVRREDGAVFCWGANDNGQLGDGTQGSRALPVRVAALSRVDEITAGEAHSCAIRSSGRMSCWGANSAGQLGSGTVRDHLRPVGVVSGWSILQAAGGAAHSCSLRDTGEVYCWGSNAHGQLGNGSVTDSRAPVRVNLPGLTR